MGKVASEGCLLDRFSAPVVSRTRLSALAFELRIERPGGFDFEPGQWIRFLWKEKSRDYTLVNGREDPFLTLCIRRAAAGFSVLLSELLPGRRLEFSGPHGYFTFKPSRRPAVCIATGTGIAPFVAYHRHHHTAHLLLHGVSRASELYYGAELKHFARQYLPCLSKEPDRNIPGLTAFHGRTTAFLADHLAPGAYDFYLCGNSEMIRDAIHIIDDRFSGSRVYTERFH